MRVDAARKGGYAASTASTRRAVSSGSFAVAEPAAPLATAGAAATRSISSLSALVALQELEGAAERRGRAVRRGRATLDALEALKLGLLAGELDAAALGHLKAAAAAMNEPSGDARLDSVLAEVGLRAAVEIAKLSRVP